MARSDKIVSPEQRARRREELRKQLEVAVRAEYRGLVVDVDAILDLLNELERCRRLARNARLALIIHDEAAAREQLERIQALS